MRYTSSCLSADGAGLRKNMSVLRRLGVPAGRLSSAAASWPGAEARLWGRRLPLHRPGHLAWGCPGAAAVQGSRAYSTGEWLPTAPIVQQLKASMDAKIIGHADLKRAIIMALLSREHVYAEGPPGVGKTMLAEVAAASTDLKFYFYQMHRDTRLQEIIGDSVIYREQDSGGGEIIRQDNRPGGIITSELCVLDDISRAPGEALNVLLRILNERKFGSADIPLLSAIATANPASDEYYTEPLDPANIDRFCFQIQSIGIIQASNWDEASRVIDLFADGPEAAGLGPAAGAAAGVASVVPRAALDSAYAAITAVRVTEEVKQGLILFLHCLSTKYKLTEQNSLLSDRTFLVKALKVLRTNAVAHQREHTVAADLEVLRFLTTFRVPAKVHAEVPGLLRDIISGKVNFDSIAQSERAFPAYSPRTVAPLKDRVAELHANGAGKGPGPAAVATKKKPPPSRDEIFRVLQANR